MRFDKAYKAGHKRIVYAWAGKSALVRIGGTRSWRNNNPGNLEYGDFAKRNGAIGTDGRFAVFPDEGAGADAQAVLLKSVYSEHSIARFIAAYAPEPENDVECYLRHIEAQAGLDRALVLGRLTHDEWKRLLAAVRDMEGFAPGQEILVDAGTQRAAPEIAPPSPGRIPPKEDFAWMRIALAEAALPLAKRSEVAGLAANPRIIEYFRIGTPGFDPWPGGGDETDWCAAFVNYCLVRAGFRGTGHPGARSFSWKSFGVAVDAPLRGAVAVLRKKSAARTIKDSVWISGPGHVGFVHSWTSAAVVLLGGNQRDAVNLSTYPLKDVYELVCCKLPEPV